MKFQTYTDKSGLTRWRLVAANGLTIADSGEGYLNAYNCRRAIQRLVRFFDAGHLAPIHDLDTGRTHKVRIHGSF